MRLAGHDALPQPCREGTNLARPFDDARRRPLQILLVRLGTVLGVGAGAMRPAAAYVTGNPLALIEDLHRRLRAARLDLLAHQLIRRAVVVAAKLDVIIQVDPRLLPLSKFKRPEWQRLQRRPIDVSIQLGTRSGKLAERTIVELGH